MPGFSAVLAPNCGLTVLGSQNGDMAVDDEGTLRREDTGPPDRPRAC